MNHGTQYAYCMYSVYIQFLLLFFASDKNSIAKCISPVTGSCPVQKPRVHILYNSHHDKVVGPSSGPGGTQESMRYHTCHISGTVRQLSTAVSISQENNVGNRIVPNDPAGPIPALMLFP